MAGRRSVVEGLGCVNTYLEVSVRRFANALRDRHPCVTRCEYTSYMRIPAAFAILLALGHAPRASASETLRCGQRLVTQGDSIAKVRALCGEPKDVVHTDILRRPSYVIDGRVVHFGNDTVAVPVEMWTYNFGPNKFMRRLKFVDGILENIESLGYGHHPAN